VPPVQLSNKRGNHLPTRGTLGVGHIDKTTSDRGRVLSMLLLQARFASFQAFAASLGAWRTHLWIEKSFKRLRGIEEPTTPCTRNPVFTQARLDPCCLGDLQQKSSKLVMPFGLGTPAFPNRFLQVASGYETGVSQFGGVTSER
jgi:hypothetical protein